jgi:hypothetical protein
MTLPLNAIEDAIQISTEQTPTHVQAALQIVSSALTLLEFALNALPIFT